MTFLAFGLGVVMLALGLLGPGLTGRLAVTVTVSVARGVARLAGGSLGGIRGGGAAGEVEDGRRQASRYQQPLDEAGDGGNRSAHEDADGQDEGGQDDAHDACSGVPEADDGHAGQSRSVT
ncbi:hypothetical protein NBEOAGPD_2822 [Methylobacterium gregans]|uniref:Uncharacterized protein n=1 Tax=Methylobacterium gregans TaxID=374424 RepID=A0AA37MC18_9HYPH|nr:hypothetical protein [Methylobacterium gregans]GJD79593.1 hypothetical protein NBEOAGPD_2822 [Methylobacterium gregans]